MYKNLNNFLINEKVFYFLLLCFASITALFYYYAIDQRAVTSGLILTDQINYTDKLNFYNLTNQNSWIATFHLVELLINAGFSLNFLNFFILFIFLYMNAIGIFLISKSLTKDNIFAFCISCIVIFANINLGSLDYPVLLISEHTNGMGGQAAATLVFGLVAHKKVNAAILFSIITIAFHIVIAAWLISILFLSIYIFEDKKKFLLNFFNKKNIIYLILIFLVLLLSFIKFQNNRIAIPFEYNHLLYTTFIEMWDHHRSYAFGINYKYIFLTILMLLMSFYSMKDKRNIKNNDLFFKIVFLQVLMSFILYFLYKVAPNLFQGIFLKVIPTRFFLIHSVFGAVIIISILYLYLKDLIKVTYISKLVFKFIFLIILVHPIIYYDKYFSKLENVYANRILGIKKDDYSFWNKVKKIDIKEGVLLTSAHSCQNTLQNAKKPILLCIEAFDNVSYTPAYAESLKNILEKIYEIDFFNPPEKNRGGLNDITYKKTFEKRSVIDWVKISNEFNIKGLILPIEWNLQLDKSIIGKRYIFYKL
tara:strand:- start:3935 stop:5536 length:1602 start_codon:yes stop_codon:yes gene_type:complete